MTTRTGLSVYTLDPCSPNPQRPISQSRGERATVAQATGKGESNNEGEKMATQLIEGKTGREQHSSTWGKFFLHGISLVADEKTFNRHEGYIEGSLEIEDGVMFTIWAASGDKHGTNDNDYYIAVTDSTQPQKRIGNGYGEITGCFRILAHGDGKVRAPRLLEWVKAIGEVGRISERLALHLGEEIHRRGAKTPRPLAERKIE